MRKTLAFSCLLIILIGFSSSALYAQKVRDDAPAHNLPFLKKLDFANGLFASGSFYNAIEFYQELQLEQPLNPYVAYMLAESYWRTRNYPPAAENYRKSYQAAPKEFPDSRYKMALMYKQAGDYVTARQIFTEQLNDKEEKNKDLKKLIQIQINGIDLAEKSLKNPGNYFIKNAGPNINKPYTDFSPVPLGDSMLMFSSINRDQEINLHVEKRGDYVSKLFLSDKKKYTDVRDSFMVPTEFYAGIFNDDRYHVGNGSFSPGGNKFYFTKCREMDTFKIDCKIFVSELEDGVWGKAYEMPSPINLEGSSNTHPNAVKVGKKDILYFSSDRTKQSVGGFDIWETEISPKGKYSRPKNLGKKINTKGDDVTPYYDNEKGVLFYASDGLAGMGGFDVYEAKGGPTKFVEVHNMGAPVNTPADDLYYATDLDGSGNAWMVSNRMGSVALKSPTCCDDIWRVWVAPEFFVNGKVYDAETNTELGEVAVQLQNSDGSISENLNSADGHYNFEIPISNQFSITANKEGYAPGVEYVSTMDKKISDKGATYTKDIYLEKIPEELDVQVVYYDFDGDKLRNGSHPGLNNLAAFMQKYPFTKIRITSYTDELGTVKYNEELSKRRSDAVAEYLVRKGIARERMETVGKGELRGKNATVRQENRRTDFKVIGEVPGVRINYLQNQPEYIDRSTRRRADTEVNKEIPAEEEPVENTPAENSDDDLKPVNPPTTENNQN